MSVSSPLVQRADPSQTAVDHAISSVSEDVGGPKYERLSEDSRSSSLSDIEAGKEGDHPTQASIGEFSDGNDTEAETERLEESPEKARQQQNLVLTTSVSYPSVSVVNGEIAGQISSGRAASPLDNTAPNTSDISSLGESDSERLAPSPLGSPSRNRKRKRPIYSADVVEQAVITASPQRRYSSVSEEHISPNDVNQNDWETGIPGRERSVNVAVERKTTSHTRASDEMPDEVAGDRPALVESIEGLDSNGEEATMGDVDDAAEIDAVQRSEEILLKKKAASQSLNDINRYFSMLTERLYAEKLERLDHELEVLQQSEPSHPELLTAIHVIDQYRDEKIRYEIVRRKLKMQCLQRKSIAEKAQAHSQYQQSVRDIRESHIEHINKEQSQIHRERRDLGVLPYAKSFPVKRSQQIRHQHAYNLQVSLLSGVAKHTGFPAAPDLQPAKASEIEGDMTLIRSLQPTPDPRRGSLPAISSFSRQRSNIDEQRFLERTPWANPQHPAHSMSHNYSVFSQPQSPTVTPAVQRRVADSSALQDSAGSTIPEAQSGPTSSMAPTPVSGDGAFGPTRTFRNYTPSHAMDPTPSRQVAPPSSYTFLDSGSKRGSAIRNPVSIEDDTPTAQARGDKPQNLERVDYSRHLPLSLLASRHTHPEVKMEERQAHGLYSQHPTVVGASPVS